MKKGRNPTTDTPVSPATLDLSGLHLRTSRTPEAEDLRAILAEGVGWARGALSGLEPDDLEHMWPLDGHLEQVDGPFPPRTPTRIRWGTVRESDPWVPRSVGDMGL